MADRAWPDARLAWLLPILRRGLIEDCRAGGKWPDVNEPLSAHDPGQLPLADLVSVGGDAALHRRRSGTPGRVPAGAGRVWTPDQVLFRRGG
jgi:hypothetical protein